MKRVLIPSIIIIFVLILAALSSYLGIFQYNKVDKKQVVSDLSGELIINASHPLSEKNSNLSIEQACENRELFYEHIYGGMACTIVNSNKILSSNKNILQEKCPEGWGDLGCFSCLLSCKYNLESYSFLTIKELKNLSLSKNLADGNYSTEGYITNKFDCPPCPPGAECTICFDSIVISERFNLVQDDSNLKEDEMLIWLQGNYWQGDRSKYLLGDKYMFYFSYKNKTGLNIVNSAPVNKNG